MLEGALGHVTQKNYDKNYDIICSLFLLYLGLAHLAKQTNMKIHSLANAEIRIMLHKYAWWCPSPCGPEIL